MPSNNPDQFDDVHPEMAVRCSCDICMETYDSKVNIPRVVKCGHSACQKCIKRMIDKNKNYKCPFCAMVTSVQSVEALPINRSLIGTLITHQGYIVDYVRTEGQKPSREEAEPSYFCAHRTCFGGTRVLKEMAVCKTQGCDQFRKTICLSCAVEHHQKHDVVRLEKLRALREKSRSQLNDINEEATKQMRGVYTLIGRTNGLKEDMWQHFTSNTRMHALFDRCDQLHSDQEAADLQKIGRDSIKLYTEAMARWKASLGKITTEMEELFGSEEEEISGKSKITDKNIAGLQRKLRNMLKD